MNGTEAKDRTGTILIVEDDPAQRKFLEKLLQQTGYRCQTAECCAEGRERFAFESFALGLIDLGLPDGSGLSLLGEFVRQDPTFVPIVLTGDSNTETVIGTMRAGAFDYLTKPVDRTTLAAALARAFAHHTVRRERAELLGLLIKEKEQLEARVQAATADIRQYATACEVSNARLRSLLSLTQLTQTFFSDEILLRSTFKEVARHVPLRCLTLCDVSRQRILGVYPHEPEDLHFINVEVGGNPVGYDALLAEAEPRLLVQLWVERNINLDTQGLSLLVFPQRVWSRSVCTIGFHVEEGFDVTASDEEFLGMCAHFLAFEWEQANLLLHVAHHASLGNIALELARNFVQPLTALRTTTDFVSETVLTPEASEGLAVIRENVERLRRQTQEFRKLSLLREGCVETVQLDEYINQALDILAVAIQNRGVIIEKSFDTDCECVLLNGTALARTFLDLILSALRSTELGSRLHLSLHGAGSGHVVFEICYNGSSTGYAGRLPEAEDFQTHPGLQLAERTVHTCGGKMSVTVDRSQKRCVRVVLPRNASDPSAAGVA